MEERSEVEKMDEIMLPGFRFHPTDEELVGFYLKRKVQQRPLSIELIKQLDIYKYDPWDLPKLAAIGEKEWYFYCPRDRKYRNSTRPNRVTGAGFWKATGTDRPIYSSEGSKCIGLKKSLVFYKGRAAKGIKTDWMMHEFRLPSLTDSAPQKRFLERSIPANDSWAICRIFKKTNTSAQRAVSHSWVSPLPQTTTSDILPQLPLSTHFTSENMSPPAKSNLSIQFSSKNDLQNLCVTTNFSPSYFPSSKPQISLSNENYVPFNCLFPNEPSKSIVDASSMLQNMSSSIFGDFNRLQDQQCNGFSITLPQEMQQNGNHIEEQKSLMKDLNGENFEVNDQWGIMGCSGLPLGLASAWKSNLVWDNSSPCPSEISTNYSTNKCYM